jgi:hypothetical protein
LRYGWLCGFRLSFQDGTMTARRGVNRPKRTIFQRPERFFISIKKFRRAKIFICARIARTACRSKLRRASSESRRQFTERRASASKSSNRKKTGSGCSSPGSPTIRAKKKTKLKSKKQKKKGKSLKAFPFFPCLSFSVDSDRRGSSQRRYFIRKNGSTAIIAAIAAMTQSSFLRNAPVAKPTPNNP